MSAWRILARKPLAGTVAANVLEHGTGAINVDGCRIGHRGRQSFTGARRVGTFGGNAQDSKNRHHYERSSVPLPDARWPANVVLDEEAAAMLDEQAGERASGSLPAGTQREGIGYRGGRGCEVRNSFEANTGGASRFFYCPKADRAERDIGTHGGPRQAWTDGRAVPADNPRLRGVSQRGNFHPTVKPVTLMAWLCRLVTPKGGLILDPFTGSGSTGIAALREGFRFVGVELSPEYARMARARIEGDAPLLNGGAA